MMDWQTLLNSNRPRTSSSPGEHRSQFERDFDRCAFSTPVKRLQDKAQVFPLEAHDGVRTRLTHSLEVSSVARGLAVAIAKWLAEQGHLITRADETVYDMQRSIETICATCGLIHDLGNPPFGHAGEYAIQDWFVSRFGNGDRSVAHGKLTADGLSHQEAADLLNFDGNAQTIRLVTKLQVLADFHGLNLTWGTLSALRKYVSSSTSTSSSSAGTKKPGHFASEEATIADIVKETGVGVHRNPLTFIVEAADDIVYSVADIEDAVKKRVLTWPDLEQLLKAESDTNMDAIFKRKDAILAPGSDPTRRIRDEVHASAFRTAAIATLVPSVVECFRANYSSLMNGSYTTELVKGASAASVVKTLKRIGAERVYCTQETLRLELMGKNVIFDLMDLFWAGIEDLPEDSEPDTRSFNGKAGALLSSNYKDVFRHSIREKQCTPLYCRFQLLTDYISGMTDTYCKHLHEELFNG